MTKAYSYKGILAKPMGNAHWMVAALSAKKNAAAWEEAADEERRLLTERLDALFRDFGMVPEHKCVPFFQLLLKLAERHVPGFDKALHRGRGQPQQAIEVELIDQIEGTMSKRKVLARSAARLVAKARSLGESVDAIETRYRRAKKARIEHEKIMRRLLSGDI